MFSYVGETYARGDDAAMLWIPSVIGTFLTGISVWHSEKYPSFYTAYARLGFFALLS